MLTPPSHTHSHSCSHKLTLTQCSHPHTHTLTHTHPTPQTTRDQFFNQNIWCMSPDTRPCVYPHTAPLGGPQGLPCRKLTWLREQAFLPCRHRPCWGNTDSWSDLLFLITCCVPVLAKEIKKVGRERARPLCPPCPQSRLLGAVQTAVLI